MLLSGYTAYASNKFALRGLAETLQMEVSKRWSAGDDVNMGMSRCNAPSTCLLCLSGVVFRHSTKVGFKAVLTHSGLTLPLEYRKI